MTDFLLVEAVLVPIAVALYFVCLRNRTRS
jgi:hypothetical protein